MHLFASTALLWFAASLPAQQRFADLDKRVLPLEREPSAAAAFGDIDQDGDEDVIVAGIGYCLTPWCVGATNRAYLGDGHGSFRDATALLLSSYGFTTDVELGDVDGDGDLDLLVANTGFYNPGSNQLQLNDGTGRFVDVTGSQLPRDSDATVDLALADVDGDGDLDLAVANAGYYRTGLARLYLNDGSGTFTDATATRLPAGTIAYAVLLVDVDGDGDRDWVLGAFGLLLYDGRGFFRDASSTWFSTLLPSEGVRMADVDRDGDPDLIVWSRSSVEVLTNTGQSFVRTGAALSVNCVLSIALADVDGDAAPDLVVGTDGGQNRLFLNDGAGTFRDATARSLPFDDDDSAVALSDVDGDGDQDLVCNNLYQQSRLYLNRGDGVFEDATRPHLVPLRERTFWCAASDVDGDGDLDAVSGSQPGYRSGRLGGLRLDRNDGTGRFVVDAAGLPAGPEGVITGLLVDIDLDGDPDLITGRGAPGTATCTASVYANDGRGAFTEQTGKLPPAPACIRDLCALDYDRDADLDLVLATQAGLRTWTNAGTGAFTDESSSRLPANARGDRVVAADVDGDQDLDLVSSEPALFLNDGSGVFVAAPAGSLPLVDATSVCAGDFDGDGDQDLAFGATNGRTSCCFLFENDGAGRFTDVTQSRIPAVRGASLDILALDVDGDADLDLVVATPHDVILGGIPDQLYLNDGRGFFTDATTSMPNLGQETRVLARGDLDGDGDEDLLLGVDGGRNQVLFNLQRHLDAPLPMRPGRPYPLVAHTRSPGGEVVLPFASVGGASIALPPLGTVRFDPLAAITLPPLGVPANGSTRYELAIPALASLTGQDVWLQAVAISALSPARLTNALHEVVLP